MITIPSELIQRNVDSNIKPTIDKFAGILEEIVNFGSNILIWDDHPKTNGEENVPPTMLF